MGATSTDSLFLQVDASVELLRRHMAEGEQPLDKFAAKANATADAVDASLAKMGDRFPQLAKMAETAASQIQRSFEDGFSQVEKLAAKALSGPRAGGGVGLGAAEAKQAAADAQRQAQAIALVEQAAIRAAAGEGELSAATDAYLKGARAATIAAEGFARELAEEAGFIERVEIELNQLGTAHADVTGKVTGGSNAQRFAMQSLGAQFTDFTVEVGSGQGAVRAFVQQMPQAAFALGQFEGGLGKVGAFLNGPWGIALQVGLIALSAFVGKLLEHNDALSEAVEELKQDAAAREIGRQAQDIFARSAEGVTAAINDQKAALDEKVKAQKSAAAQDNIDAQNNLAAVKAIRDHTKALLEQAIAEVELQKVRATAPGQRGENATLALDAAQSRLDGLRNLLAQNDTALSAALENFDRSRVALAAELGKEAADPRSQLSKSFDKQIADAQAATNSAIASARAAGKNTTALANALTATITDIETARAAALEKFDKTRRDSKKVAPDPASSSSALLSSAERYRGAGESGSGRATLDALFKSAGINIDPKITAWCAAFVNAVLATNGLKGTGSPAAKSFLGFGTATNSPQKGDIVVSRRDGGGHVGFFEGFDKNGNVRVLGGNTGNKVGVQTVSRADVLGFRRAPGSAQAQDDASAKSAADAAERNARYADQLSRAQEELLGVTRQLAGSAEEQLADKLKEIETERQRENAKIDADAKMDAFTAVALKLTNDKIASAKSQLATEQNTEATLRRKLDADRAELDAKMSVLSLQLDLATTQKDRLRIARQMLDAEFKKRRDAAVDKLSSTDKRVRDEGQRELDQANAEAPLRYEQAKRQYAGPLEQWKSDAADTKTILESIEVKAIDQLNDGLIDAVKNALHLHGVFGDILGDLLKMALHKAEMAAIDALFSAAGASSGGGGGGGFNIGKLLGFAAGGEPPVGVPSIVGERGPELFIPKVAGTIIPNHQLRAPRIPTAAAMGGGGGAAGPMQIVLKVAKGEAFAAEVVAVSGPHTVAIVREAAPAIVSAAADHTIARISRPGL